MLFRSKLNFFCSFYLCIYFISVIDVDDASVDIFGEIFSNKHISGPEICFLLNIFIC